MKIFLIGEYPPPYGGVSIHIKRLYEKLKDKIFIEIFSTSNERRENDGNIINKSIKKSILSIFFMKKNEIYHFHESSIKIVTLISIFSFITRNKIILTIHNDRFEVNYNKANFICQLIIRKFLKYITYIILVGGNTKNFLLKCKTKNISIIPGYINPTLNVKDYEKIDKNVWKFIKNARAKKYKIISANGNIRFFNKEDLYGLDLLIELTYLLKKNGYKVSLVFALLGYENQSSDERNYFEKLLKKIRKYKIENYIFIYKVKNTEFYPILDKTDIFIRPTNTDSYGISVTEAIYLKKPAIASDVCLRQEGTIYFKSRNITDLLEKTKFVLNNYDREKTKLEKIKIKEYYEDVLEIYKKVYEGKNINEK